MDESTLKQSQRIFLETLFNMKRLSPYYHAVLCAITRKPLPGLGTCAVTEDTLFYDPEFIVKLSVPELTFVLIHEIMHIAMQHSVRFGGRASHELWNIACDLYINTIICRDFGIQYGSGEKRFGVDDMTCSIAAPPFGVFPDTSGQTLDLERDMPESIYERLLRDNPMIGATSGVLPAVDERGGCCNPVKPFDVCLDGKNLQGKLPVDIMTNRSYGSAQERQVNIDAGKMALQRIKTRIAMEEEESGEPLSLHAGPGGDLVGRYIEFGLSQDIRWQNILRNLCMVRRRKIFNAALPNFDYMNLGMTLADRREVGKPSELSCVKLCVDVSGSIDEEKLKWLMSEINGLLSLYHVDGELIYWSTVVGDAGSFMGMKDMVRIDPVSDGGTDVLCLFEYLTGKVKVNGRYEKDKVRDIPAVFVFTDGQFDGNYGDYAEIFGRKVIWIIAGNAVSFTPLFGRVVQFRD